ncbi:MAG TPA: pirin family protein [Steroidobacteraceae bacterium]|jgi:redox-sensitive bicupin YhaK (pirin superfamily)|nr:pirin family protein [Steroidobacteraceae bacterium]
MKEIRRSNERGAADHGWLQSRHSFSFASYQDPRHTQFGPLRVINEDRVQAGAGFGTHSHRDMEIVSYVLEGALAHKDSTGTSSVIRPGDVQRMSAGTGVSHSEFNASKTEPVHFLQIWIIPDRVGIPPSYEEAHFAPADRRGRLRLIASPDKSDGSVLLHQNASIFSGLFDGDEHATLAVAAGRHSYIHVARGSLHVAGLHLEAGDGLRITDAGDIEFKEGKAAEVIAFDLPG